MRIVISTIPIRAAPIDSPPFGALAIIQALRRAGHDPYFLDLDVLRPSTAEIARFLEDHRPDLFGISGVVSTGYGFAKRLALLIRSVSPRTRIVVGANLAASAEILHRKAGVDYCVIGDGEKVAVNLCRYIAGRAAADTREDYQALGAIPGLTFLDPAGDLVFTGYEESTPVGEMPDPDYSILERYSRLDNFLSDPLAKPDFAKDPRSHEPRRRGQKRAVVLSSKGCVSRCAFCHRWEKGYRIFPVAKVVGHMRHLKERYNAGFFTFGDENFGSNRRQVEELIAAVKPLDILYMLSGVRCSTVDPGLLRSLKESGCVSLNYGMEAGSSRILQVMEKGVTKQQNLQAALWTQAEGLYTIYQLVLGMPGENADTIAETTEFFKQVTQDLPESPLIRFRVNYLQVLPGTPVYEYARRKGLLGRTLDEEERYLLGISDIDAADETRFLNLTGLDYWTVQSWRRRIILDCNANYRKRNRIPAPGWGELCLHTLYRWLRPAAYERLRQAHSYKGGQDFSQSGYFNFLWGFAYDVMAAYLYPARSLALWSWMLARDLKRLGPRAFLGRLRETLRYRCGVVRPEVEKEYRSVRKMVEALPPAATTPSEAAMAPLRSGR